MKLHSNLEKIEMLAELSDAIGSIQDNIPDEDKIGIILDGISILAQIAYEDLIIAEQKQGLDRIS